MSMTTSTPSFYECDADENYVWGVYFSPKEEAHKIDAVYSMHFERIFIRMSITERRMKLYSNLNQSYEDLQADRGRRPADGGT